MIGVSTHAEKAENKGGSQKSVSYQRDDVPKCKCPPGDEAEQSENLGGIE
jgi:hypothetical protein